VPPAKRPLSGQALLRRIRERGPEPVYLVYGRERWFSERALSLLRGTLFAGEAGQASRALNYDVFTGKEVTARALNTACRTFPMFSDVRLVVVREGSRIPADEWKGFLPYMDDPPESTCLFVDWGHKKPDGRTRWVRNVKKHGALAESRPLYDREVPDFLAYAARSRSLTLDPDAAAYLSQVVGSDLHALDDAMERLGLFSGERDRVTLEDVESCVADTRAHEVWDLTDAVAARDLQQALRVLGRVRQQGASAVHLLASLHRTIRQLWQARELQAEGTSRDALAQALGVHPFVAGKVGNAARRFSDAALADAIRALAGAEVATRTGGLKAAVKEWVVLEGLVTSLCSSR